VNKNVKTIYNHNNMTRERIPLPRPSIRLSILASSTESGFGLKISSTFASRPRPGHI